MNAAESVPGFRDFTGIRPRHKQHRDANQFLGLLKLAREGKGLEKRVYELPPEQDQEIARTKLHTMGLAIDALTPEQAKYATDYSAGT